jgi:serine/threonine protein kinase
VSECSYLAELERILASPRDERDWEALAGHLDTCASCRERVETLTDLDSLAVGRPGEAQRNWRRQSSSSVALQQAIQRLHAISPPVENHEAAPRAGGAPLRLAFLKPSEQPGFIGKLGGYDVRRVIGQGGMGVVLEAQDPTLRRTVAIKLVSPWAVFDEQTKGRFLREAQTAAALTHENVVTIFAVDQVDGMPFLVLEYVAGESLEDRIQREGKLPLDEVARLGAQVARGLTAAHAKGLVHRDIKPANILLDETTERAKITDFGLAKTTGEQALTMTGTVIGTPEFMSPEQAGGKDPDERSDLFSLGAVLYCAATGVAPFHGSTLLVTLDNVRKCQPRPLREIDSTLPQWFCDLVHRLLSKDPQQRIGWASAVAELLEQRGGQKTVVEARSARDTVKAIPVAHWPPNSLPRWWQIAPAVLAIGAVIVWATWYFGGGENNTISPQPASETASTPPQPQAGFTLGSSGAHFATLADALTAANEGDVIEVHGNGPFLTPPLTVTGKRITIRAAGGSHPIFLSDNFTGRATQNFLQTDADLRLEGLEIRWAVPFVSGTSDAEMLARCTIRSTYGRLILDHCRIISPNACIGAGSRDVILRGCHLVSTNAVGVFWRSQSGGKLDVEESILETRMAIAVRADRGVPGVSPPSLRLARCTIASEKCLQLVVEGSAARQALPIAAENNIIDSEHLIWIIRQLTNREKGAAKRNEPADVVHAWFNWSERGNVYRRGIKYISRPAPFTESGLLSVEYQGVDGWLESWKLPPERSVEGKIQFKARAESAKTAPLSIDAINDPSGPQPADVGARPHHVGPGTAYHSWRSSPDYADWPPK